MTPRDMEIRARCSRRLSGHRMPPVREVLSCLADHPAAGLIPDIYGGGGAVALLEERMAGLLGKERAIFFTKGVIAQQSVLLAAREARGTPFVVIHPLSHMEVDEADGLDKFLNFRPIRLGRARPFTVRNLEGVQADLAAVVVELPLRRAGYLLLPWPELVAISEWCRGRGVPLHFDGARIYETAAAYGRPVQEVAALADTVYASLYKGLGGLGGCVVAGDAAFLARMRIWKSRQGGDVFTSFPQAISALAGIERYLPRMGEFHARARGLAARLGAEGIGIVNPAVPHVNAFQLVLPGDPADLTARNLAFAEKHGVWLFNFFVESALQDHAIAEISIGDCADDWTDDEAVHWIRQFVSGAF